MLWEEGGTQVGVSLYLHNGKIHAGAWNRTGQSWANDVFVATPYQVGEVYHVVVVLKPAAGRLKLYVNGQQAAWANGVGLLDSHAGRIAIGARDGATRYADKVKTGGFGEFLDGVVDEVAVYNKALTQVQVQAHYAAGLD